MINATLVGLGSKCNVADYSLYYAHDGPYVMFVLVYVDDMIVLSIVIESKVALKTIIMDKYDMKHLEEV